MVRREPGRNDQERKPEARNRISFVFTRPLWMAWHEAGTSNCGVSLLCKTARELGIGTTCFVFPRNLVAYLADLRDAGFTCFRDVDELPVRFANKTLTSVEKVLADFAGLSPRM